MKTVFVLGAGPAGLFAARKLADAGHNVVIFNRDIKPGGLAEYGIYPTKDKMKHGLRKQFAKILALENISYFGHVNVGYNISLDALRAWNPAAIVVAVGAQGTKHHGILGEAASGVYAAKDFVYHYNRLPPFSTRDYSTGRRVAIVGMGNVMVDVARWLLQDDPDLRTEEVIVLARRGPFEAKFERAEFAHIEKHLDRDAFEQELLRIQPHLPPGEDIARVSEATFPILAKQYKQALPRLTFRFLCTPKTIHQDRNGRIERLTVAENRLVMERLGVAAEITGRTSDIECDTLINAIGDVVDPQLGLPVSRGGYETNPSTTYESEPGIFVVGWARIASEGLVGTTRMEAERGATLALRYLEHLPAPATASLAEIAAGLPDAVTKDDLPLLERAESAQAASRGLSYFKFSEDAAMMAAISKEKRSREATA